MRLLVDDNSRSIRVFSYNTWVYQRVELII